MRHSTLPTIWLVASGKSRRPPYQKHATPTDSSCSPSFVQRAPINPVTSYKRTMSPIYHRLSRIFQRKLVVKKLTLSYRNFHILLLILLPKPLLPDLNSFTTFRQKLHKPTWCCLEFQRADQNTATYSRRIIPTATLPNQVRYSHYSTYSCEKSVVQT